MKIVDVSAFYAPKGGGVRTYVEQKLAAAPAWGHEVVVIAPGEVDRSEVRGPGARIEWIATPRFPLDRNYRYFDDVGALHRRIRRERPDFLEASSPWRSASMVADYPGACPRAIIMHADPTAAYAYRWFETVATPETVDRRVMGWFWNHLRVLGARFDMVVSASDSLSERLRGQGVGRVATVPMGVEGGLFSPSLRDEALRARMLARCKLPPDSTLLIAVGRHAPEKRWPMVIEAVRSVAFTRSVGLILVGDGRDRARTVREIDGDPHVHLLAPITNRLELARLMASADALVHGCEAETFSMVAAEAAASGLPLIVPSRGGAADHAAATGGYIYASASAADAARVVHQFLDDRAPRRAGNARTMDQHFGDLFMHYEALAATRLKAA